MEHYIDYNAILKWIKNVGVNPFPPSLRCGRIVYYHAIPDSITLPIPANDDELFWKHYIDFAMGFRDRGTWLEDIHHRVGYGEDFAWNGSELQPQPMPAAAVDTKVAFAGATAVSSLYARKAPYMDYRDNPMRPKTRGWFGPMTMLEFIFNDTVANPAGGSRVGTLAPGAAHQAQSFALKIGVRAALLDAQRNHPNDNVGLVFFAGAETGWASPARFRTVREPLGQRHQRMIDSLFFPQATIDAPGTEIGWNAPEMNNVPNAYGGTCYDLPLLLTHNQFSGHAPLKTANAAEPYGSAGGMGRHGAQKIVVFETDGVANTKCEAPTLNNPAPGASWYNARAADPLTLTWTGWWTSGNFPTIAAAMAQPHAAGGFSLPGRPLNIHTLAFGYVFEPANSSLAETQGAYDALAALQNAGNIDDTAPALGNTLWPGSQLADYKVITGTPAQRADKLTKAFTKILQEGAINVSLIE